MSVQRWSGAKIAVTEEVWDSEFVLYTDHARIVAEMEQAHAAALAEAECPDPTICEREDCVTAAAYRAGGEDAIAEYARNMPRAAAPRTLTRDGWWPFGSFVDYDFPLEFDGEGEDGLPIWERPDKSRLAPRTLTADDPEPAVGSVVLFDGLPYIRQGNKWVAPRANSAYWYEFMRDERPTVLIHDGGAA